MREKFLEFYSNSNTHIKALIVLATFISMIAIAFTVIVTLAKLFSPVVVMLMALAVFIYCIIYAVIDDAN